MTDDDRMDKQTCETDNSFLHRRCITEAANLIVALNDSRVLQATGDVPLRELLDYLNDWTESLATNIG